MVSEDKIIKGCMEGKRLYQSMLYNRYASKMLGICFRYCKTRDEAEDVMQEGFVKVFFNIKKFRGEGSFEGWIKKIMINTAINNYQSNLKRYFHSDIDTISETLDLSDSNQSELIFSESDNRETREKIINALQKLPDGYRIVMNLYVFEQYTHREIADYLNITESTSKSQLSKARKYFKKLLAGDPELNHE